MEAIAYIECDKAKVIWSKKMEPGKIKHNISRIVIILILIASIGFGLKYIIYAYGKNSVMVVKPISNSDGIS